MSWRDNLEPSAGQRVSTDEDSHSQRGQAAIALSQALSLKRIADALERGLEPVGEIISVDYVPSGASCGFEGCTMHPEELAHEQP